MCILDDAHATTMSNFEVRVCSNSRGHLRRALAIAFADAPQGATHWKITDDWLVLCWHEDKTATKLPCALDRREAFRFVVNWLDKQKPTDPSPDIDGSVENEGFELESVQEGWGYAFVKVRKIWALYHK